MAHGWACFDMVDFEDVVEENKKLARRLGKKKAEKELKWEPPASRGRRSPATHG